MMDFIDRKLQQLIATEAEQKVNKLMKAIDQQISACLGINAYHIGDIAAPLRQLETVLKEKYQMNLQKDLSDKIARSVYDAVTKVTS